MRMTWTKYVGALVLGITLLGLAQNAGADTAGWYEVTFTGKDMWTYSAYNAAQTAVDQAAPHRYATYDAAGRTVVATTWGTPPPPAAGNFATWAATPAGLTYAIDEFNLWGAGGSAMAPWGEKYVSVGTGPPEPGVSSWKLISAPAGWTGPNGIVQGGETYSADATHAFPVWRVGTGTPLSQANMNDPQFSWTFDVLVSNPLTAFETDGTLKVFWGGFDNSSPVIDDVAGIMKLQATAVPEPLTMAGVFLSVSAIGAYIRKRKMA